MSVCFFRKHYSCAAIVILCTSLGTWSLPATAQSGLPVCQAANSDPDGDGWGWENNSSCIVAGSAVAPAAEQQTNFCLYLSSDDDGDGWGWENNASCRVGADTSNATPVQRQAAFIPVLDTSGRAICQLENADPDGDGYGWENNASCIVEGTAAAAEQDNATAACSSPNADPDGDGWGWENNASCIVVAGSPVLTPEPDSDIDDSNSVDDASVIETPQEANTEPEETSPNRSLEPDTDFAEDAVVSVTESPANENETVEESNAENDNQNENKNDAEVENQQPANDNPTSPAPLATDITDLILITGQSNTLGSNTSVDETLDAPHPRVFAYTDEGWQVAELYQTWDRGAHPGTGDRADVDKTHNNFALHFGKRLTELDDDAVVGFVLVSEPGEGISHWDSGAAGMLRVQGKVLEAINSLPHKSAIDGVLWHQGETDWQLEGTSDPDARQPAPIDYYPVRLTTLIQNLRLENWYSADAPFICGETIQAVGVNTHLYGLNTDDDPQTACVEGAGLPAVRDGGNHLNAEALRTLGQRYAESYIQLR